MLKFLKKEANSTYTENGAVTYATTMSDCLDLFATIGALRGASEEEILKRFIRAYAENPDMAMRIAFFARDVRGGLGERRTFRIILAYLAQNARGSVLRNIENIPEYGRFDDLLALMDTPCQGEMLELVAKQLKEDLEAQKKEAVGVSLLAKWLPSVNASNAQTIQNAKRIARSLKMSDAQYRKMLSGLRHKIAIIENNLRKREYVFDYSKQPSKAMFKYRKAFIRNDKERYVSYMERVKEGKDTLHTGTLYPYELMAPCFAYGKISEAERSALDTTWNALPNYANDEDALVVVDGSGSMYGITQGMAKAPLPAAVALSLGLYFAERNKGAFRNHFITFSTRPQLVEVKGSDLWERVQYAKSYNEVADTNIEAVFELILKTALNNKLKQSDMPSALYIVSDMEFNRCAEGAELSNFENAKKLFAQHGFRLPRVVFWNVASRNMQQPVTENEVGVALVSGCTPRLFEMVISGELSPYQYMLDTLSKERYAKIFA